MQLRDDECIGARVETTSGARVGTLVGFVVDTETGFVVQYRVRPRGMIAAVLPGMRELLIAHAQVVSFDASRMVVRDGAVPDTGGGRRRAAPAIPSQALTSESE